MRPAAPPTDDAAMAPPPLRDADRTRSPVCGTAVVADVPDHTDASFAPDVTDRSPAAGTHRPAVLAVGAGSAGWAHALQRAGLAGGVDVRSAADVAGPVRASAPVVGGSSASSTAFDVLLLVDVCAHQDGPANERLLVRLAALGRPGSLIVVDERTDPATTGTDWPVSSYARWLTDAGFADVRVERAAATTGVLVHAVLRGPEADEEAS